MVSRHRAYDRWWSAWTLLLLAVAVHAVVLLAAWQRAGAIDAFAFRSLDGREYFNIAANIVRHGAFSDADPAETAESSAHTRAGEPVTGPPLDFWRTPGYPLFMTPVIFLFGENPAAVVLAQQVLSILNVMWLFALCRRITTRTTAWFVAACFLFEPFHLYYSLWILSSTLFTTAALASWWAWQRRGRIITGAVCGGLIIGAAILIRPVALLWPLIYAVGMIVTDSTVPFVRRLLRPAMFVFVCVLVFGAWMARNHHHAGHWALSNQGGVVMAYFKATEVILWQEDRTADRYAETSLDEARRDDPHPVWDSIDRRLQEQWTGSGPEERKSLNWRNIAQGNDAVADSFAVSNALYRIGIDELRQRPLSTIACGLSRMGGILTFPLNLAFNPPSESGRPAWKSWAIGLGYLALVLTACAGLFVQRHGWRELYWPVVAVIGLLLATTPQLDPRFRVPMMPFLICLALLIVNGNKRSWTGQDGLDERPGADSPSSSKSSSSSSSSDSS